MKLLKIMYYVNFVLLFIETITNYMYNNNLMWLCIMLLAYIVQLVSVYEVEKKEKNMIN